LLWACTLVEILICDKSAVVLRVSSKVHHEVVRNIDDPYHNLTPAKQDLYNIKPVPDFTEVHSQTLTAHLTLTLTVSLE
jgi:hypothetical protein